jgi:hypothetical protein
VCWARSRTVQEEKTLFGYTNEDNPFNDQNLTRTFIWKKKYEKEVANGADPRKLTKERIRKEQEALRAEIEKVKERRARREQEKFELEKMREMMEREKDIGDNLDWEEKEEKFHLQQAAARSEIRIREGREKAIDLLAKNLLLTKTQDPVDPEAPLDMDIELTEPYRIFDGLELAELEELQVRAHAWARGSRAHLCPVAG